MFRKMRYLQRRGGVWWIRRPIPRHLWPILGKREHLVSLRTGDVRLAERRATAILPKIEQRFVEAERVDPLVVDRRPRTQDEEEGIDAHLTMMLEQAERGLRELTVKERERLTALLRRDEANDDDENPPVSILFDRYYKDRQLPPKSRLEWENVKARLIKLVGDAPVRSVSKAMVRKFKDALVDSVNERRGGQPLSAATVRKLLNAVSAVFSFAVRQGYIEANPCAGLSTPRSSPHASPLASQQKRLPFTDADVLAILEATKGEHGAGLWLPRLAVYSGARAGELCGLCVAEVITGDKYPRMTIQSSEVRTVKTASSVRQVPIHPELIRLGFLDYVEEHRRAGHSRLFPELKVTSYGSASAVYSKRFGRLLRSIGITDRRKVLHSARHTVKDKLRAAMVPVETQNALLGHAADAGGSNASPVGENYGLGWPVKVLQEAVSKIRYE